MLHHVPTVELQDRIFAELARVVAPGGSVVLNDSIGSDALRDFHHGDVYNPVDPSTLETRLAHAGFSDAAITVKAGELVRAGVTPIARLNRGAHG